MRSFRALWQLGGTGNWRTRRSTSAGYEDRVHSRFGYVVVRKRHQPQKKNSHAKKISIAQHSSTSM